MEHPEYLFNETTDEEFVLVTRKVSTPAAAILWLREFTGADYDEIEVAALPVWLKPGPPPEGMEGYCAADEWYGPAEGVETTAALYWKTMV